MKPLASIFVKLFGLGVVLLFASSLALASEGETIFKSKCSMCHGQDGKGFAAIHTPNFTDPKVQASLTDKQMEEIIKNGKKGTSMPPFGDKLKEEEIKDVIGFIRSLNSAKKK
jgi:cytochrome c oxidase cbb3-type subunit III